MTERTHPVERAVATALVQAGARRGDRILIALSGGADSVALTRALHRLDSAGYAFAVAHLNHRLRGAESDRDERFVRELCDRLQIELFVEFTEALAGSSNLEERARHLRYEFFDRVADRISARYIALAHHADDQAETVMMRLLRGSGAAGLAAMAPIGPGRIVRPLLRLRRDEILAYLRAIGAEYVSDSTNLVPAILRNRVRHELLPMLERAYAPRLRGRLTELAIEMRSLDDYIANEARRELNRRLRSDRRFDLAGFAELYPALANAVLREWLRTQTGDLRRVYRTEIERMRQLCTLATPGTIAELSRGWHLRCEYGVAVLESTRAVGAGPAADRMDLELCRDGVTAAGAYGFTFVAHLVRSDDRDFPRDPAMPRAHRLEVSFDADQIKGRLGLRGFESGDRIRPLGMTGTRKVHDVFVDYKLPRARRSNWPMVVTDSEILWIPGMVRSRFALVTASTKNLLRLTAAPDAIVQNTSLRRI